MRVFTYQDRNYQVDFADFLINSHEWDENFAAGMAPKTKILNGLTEAHWKVIYSIRDHYKKFGACPLVYQTCKNNQLRLRDLRDLFPTGYQRGACKLAGLTYREGFLGFSELPESEQGAATLELEKTYEVDALGFLMQPSSWDRNFAVFKAHELKLPGKLTDKHWQLIDYLREYWNQNHVVPTVYDTCEALNLEIEVLESLFPDGYHRGAVKIAGLRFR
ncbi:MAG: TusE/DsrC/DsvC family sulfur relay protein [bacterium]|nr:TusE/DsrC/DsvC family sulfur relay protein [bacterium]